MISPAPRVAQPIAFMRESFSLKKMHALITLTKSTPALSKVYSTVVSGIRSIRATSKLIEVAVAKAQISKKSADFLV